MEFNKILLEQINEEFMSCDQTISLAESVTAGAMQLAFSEMTNSKLFYKGGITVHSPDKIVKLLKVETSEIKNSNCVSSLIADKLGLYASTMFESDWCIATSGYCTPERHSVFEIYVYYSILYKRQIVFSDKIEFNNYKNKFSPLSVKLYYTEEILKKILSQLKLTLILNSKETNDRSTL
ncbi:CinA family protein [Chryseobacterium sp.]|uniref:CinA family protein n=1 Tax=Chryseobacterium sp. TaxID=1871047 RepID=UPI0025BD54E4|nr:CinA family protein [Chryseobacterium sp.]MBV8326645.1 CinA family protein [Chryseobacterium sp.]